MVGYYGNDAATAETLTADGYVRTGDLAELDGKGGFTFLSRMGDVLRLSGFLVNPLEIETHIQPIPGIDACQTIAVPGLGRARRRLRHPEARRHARRGRRRSPTAGAASPTTRCRSRVFAIDDFPETPSPNGFKIQRDQVARDGGGLSSDCASARDP